MRLEYAIAALHDLDDIFAYTAADRPRAAGRMLRKLREACEALTEFPGRGRPAPRAAREITTVWPYVIVYRVRDDVVSIERIIHGARRR